MDRLAPYRPRVTALGLLILAATASCGQSDTSGSSRGGQGGRASVAGGTNLGEGDPMPSAGSPVSVAGRSPLGTSGSSGAIEAGSGGGGAQSASGGTTTGPNATGGNTAGGSAIGVGAGTQGGNAQGGNAQGGSGDACIASRGNYCTCMPRFVGTQNVDGSGDEFSALAPMTFALSNATYVNPSRSSAMPERVTLRAGWSDAALHVHVHVEDPAIIPDPNASLWNGDNVQVFVAPTDKLTGTYSGTEDGGALHLLVSAPDPANASRAIVIYQNGVSTNSPFVTGLFAGRRVTDGYEIEAQLQWLPIANPRRSGAGIGFDLLVGAASTSSQGLALEGGLANNPVTASSPACSLGGRVQPGCDDRTWCSPVLE